MSQPNQPQTADHWTIHSLNIHGTFFERWCQKVVEDVAEWNLADANLPIEYSAATSNRPRQSELDIWAVFQDGPYILNLVIECKKNNPELVDWVFLPCRSGAMPESTWIRMVQNEPAAPQRKRNDDRPLWTVHQGMTRRNLGLTYRLACDPRETRRTYQDAKRGQETRTSNDAVTDAAYQVALATNVLVEQAAAHSEALARLHPAPRMLHEQHLFLPVIVTTARLRICDFDPADVDVATGEIPLTKAQLSNHPVVLFECPLPLSLQGKPENPSPLFEVSFRLDWSRIHILVVQSEAFPGFLEHLATRANAILRG